MRGIFTLESAGALGIQSLGRRLCDRQGSSIKALLSKLEKGVVETSLQLLEVWGVLLGHLSRFLPTVMLLSLLAICL